MTLETENLCILEREGGYRQCHNDLLAVLLEMKEEYPATQPVLVEVLNRLTAQLRMRELSGFTYSQDVLNVLK